jgi:hypothetical protein
MEAQRVDCKSSSQILTVQKSAVTLFSHLLFLGDSLLRSLTNGASVRLAGRLVDSPGPEQDKELQVEEVEIVGGCDPEVRGAFLSSCGLSTGNQTPLGPWNVRRILCRSKPCLSNTFGNTLISGRERTLTLLC